MKVKDIHTDDYVRTYDGRIGKVCYMLINGQIIFHEHELDIDYPDIKVIDSDIRNVIEKNDVLKLPLIENLYIVKSEPLGRLFIESGDYRCYVDDLAHISCVLTHESFEKGKYDNERK